MKKNLPSKAVLKGKVVKGNRIGGKIGFPTINLEGEFDFEYGIYACRVLTSRGEYRGALHFGPRLTLGEQKPVLEICLLDFEGDLYGETVSVKVYNKIRDVKKFAGLEDLSARIKKDIAYIRKNHDKIFKE